MTSWWIIGISGGTCSGKSSLARSLYDHYTTADAVDVVKKRQVRLIKQDDYFYKRDSSHHSWIPEMNYINREILSALDMPRMLADIQNILSQHSDVKNLLIIEGFLIYNHAELWQLFDVRIHMKVSRQICLERRSHRQYNPPNPPGYFDQFIWPYYEKHMAEYEAVAAENNVKVIDLSGEWTPQKCLNEAVTVIEDFINLKCK